MKWETDLVKDIRTNTAFDDEDGGVPHPLGYSPYYNEFGQFVYPKEVTDCNRNALLEQFLKIKDNCKSILEIGIGRNSEESFAYVFFKNKKKDTVYIGLDIDDRTFLDDKENNIHTIKNDSSNYEENIKKFKELGVEKFDFIFIDGWHSINQVLKDWEYTNLLADGGIVGFHDTSCHPGPYHFVNALDTKKWNVETNLCPNDWGIGFATKKINTPKKISLICACKNRYDSLRVSLNSWLAFKEIDEYIIVDWNSDQPLNHLTKLDKRIKIIRVDDEKYFNQPQPLNLAASIASGNYILKVDVDYIINPYYNFFEKYVPDENSFICGHLNTKDYTYFDEVKKEYCIDKMKMDINDLRNYVNSFSPFFIYLNGLLFVSKENYLKIGGYNENLRKYYAYEDDEIPERLKLLGLTEIGIDIDHYLIHIPHPDSKRLENFEGKDEEYEKSVRKKLSETHQGEELQWQLDYAMAQRHIELNRIAISEITDYYVAPTTKWNIKQIDNQNYFANQVRNKLDGFPTVYYMSLEESTSRRQNLISQFESYGITNLKGIISKRFSESNDIVIGKYVHQLNDGTKGCVVSHLKALKDWYYNTHEDYAFFCEDDISLETVDYWDFTWSEFMNKLPKDWGFVQLLIIRDEFDTFELRERYWDDWAASTSYIIKRDYVKYIIDTYYLGDAYNLEIPGLEIMPLGENILSSGPGKKYAIPLIIEDTKFNSTFDPKDDQDVVDGQKNNHKKSRDAVLNWWKNKNNKKKVSESKITVSVPDTEKFDVVIQGKYEEYTDEIVDSYLSIPSVNNVIVSCWEDDKDSKTFNDRVKFIRNKYPESFGTDNRNLQIISSLNGIKSVETKYSVKTRSDQKFTNDSMENMFDFFKSNNQRVATNYYDISKPNNRIMVAGIFVNMLFCPRDHIFWGNTEDLIDLFNIPLEKYSLQDKINVNKKTLRRYVNYFIRTETYIGAHYCARFDENVNEFILNPEKYLYDNAPNWKYSFERSSILTKIAFKSLSLNTIDFEWPSRPAFTVDNYLKSCTWHEEGV